jgi:multiple sugar transport system substrate-binding protein/raffinose/stachyose/melibiose transport system substrate-binding protein
MLKGKTLADYDVTVSQVFKDSYAYVTSNNTKVSSIGWATNDDAMPSGLNDDFYAASQDLYRSNDIAAQLAKLDAEWNTATQ